MILQWLTSPAWVNVVKALLHTLWQGAAGAVLLGFALRRLNHPVVRYRCALAALGGVLLAGIITWAVLNRPLPQSISTAPAPQTQPASAPLTQNTLPPLVVHFPPAEPKPVALPWSAWLALLWLAGATAMILRAGFQVAGAERLRRSSRPLDDARMAALLDDARRAVGLARRVRIAVTDKLTSPAVVGVLLPTLILPLSLTTTLSHEQIRFVLLHELAHIRRGDYLASLFQLFAEALLFFNPAVWWISRQMRIEREACCDALAIELSGAPVDYARTLVRVAENVLRPAPAAALAFGDKRGPSSLADRVQRLLVPGYRPALRLTWRAMLVALCVGGGLLFLSALGTRVTVAAILSPQERIAQIEKKMTEYGESPELNFTYAEAEKAPKVEVSGRLRMADGSSLPKHVWVNALSIIKGSTSGTSFYVNTNGEFHGSLMPGQIIITTEIPNRAPVQIGPLWCVGTNKLENLELVISSGFSVPIQLVDAVSGKPVAGGTMSARFWLRGGNQTSFRETPLTADANGAATLPHATDMPLVVTVNTPGYEILDKKFPSVQEGRALRVELLPGEKASGVVLDKTTAQPISGATVRIISEDGPTQSGYDWDDLHRIVGRTDARGRLSITQFRSDTVYRLSVSAPGHETVVLNQVRSGNDLLTARLGSELVVKGRVTGNLQRLETAWYAKGQKELAYTFEDETEGHRQSLGERTLVRITNGVGYFQFTNRIAGLVKLHVPGETVTRRVTEPVDDWPVEIKASAPDPAIALPKREVVFRFKHPSGVPPRGTVSVMIPDNLDKNNRTAHIQEMQITNGEVHVQIAVGGRTSIESKHMVGYWFNRAGNWTSSTGESGDWLSIEVRSNSAPLVIDIPLIPAGAIYAKARNADGTPASGLLFGVSELKRAPGRDQNSLDSGGDGFSDNAPRQWVSGPLPLGGTYQIHAWRGNSFCVSRPVKLTEANPDAEVELQFPPGKTFAGTVLDADGKPLHDAEVKVTFTLPVSRDDNHSFGLKSVFTDGHRQFHFEEMTPELGEYSVEIDAPGVLAENVKLDFRSQPQTIRLQRGRTLAGRVVEAGTGYPIPGMEIRALDYEQNKLPMLTTHTDAEGRFEFTTLGDVNYTLYPDGGELLPRLNSGNQKFRADGRTNLTLTVKLYEWSNLKPKAPVTPVATTNVMGIMSDPNSPNATNHFDATAKAVALVQDGRLFYEMGKLDEAEKKFQAALAADAENASAKYYLGLIKAGRQNASVVYTGPGRQEILHKLETIRLENFSTGDRGLPLNEVLRELAGQSKLRDPEHKGINFLINNNPDLSGQPVAGPIKTGFSGQGIDVNTGLPSGPTTGTASTTNEPVDVGSFLIKIPSLTNVCYADLLDAVVLVADHPLKYSIQDFAVVFSAKVAEPAPLSIHTFKLDTNVLYTAVQTIGTPPAGSASEVMRSFIKYLGINMESPKGKTLFYNATRGVFFVRATAEDLDLIEKNLRVLDQTTTGVQPQPSLPKNSTNGTGILSDTNFQAALRMLEQRDGIDSLAEPEVTTSSGRGINRITMPSISIPITNFVSATSGQIPITFKLNRPIRFEDLKIKLKDAGVDVPPTVIFYQDNGILFARGTKEQLALVNRLVWKLNGYWPEEIEGAAKQFAKRTGAIGIGSATATNLFMRTFKIDPSVFLASLPKQTGLQTNTVPATARNFFSQLGIDLESPKGNAVFYGDRLGLLFVKATESDLDTIEQFIQSLNYTPPQIHIKARFYEVPKGTMRPNEILHGFQNFSPSNSAAHIIGILNATNAQSAFRSLQAHSTWEILAEPEATTLSGRQMQMRVTQVITVVTNMAFQDTFTNQDGTLGTNAIVPQNSEIETGPVLDVVPYVLSDGYTINLALIPSLTEFLGYDQPTNTTTAYTRTGEKISVPQVLPRFNVRQAVANLNLWDGQTAVICGLTSSSISVTKHQVPVLGDIPMLGRVFQSQSRNNIENEVLVFVTATIVDPAGNRVHSKEEIPFAKDGIPPQPK